MYNFGKSRSGDGKEGRMVDGVWGIRNWVGCKGLLSGWERSMGICFVEGWSCQIVFVILVRWIYLFFWEGKCDGIRLKNNVAQS